MESDFQLSTPLHHQDSVHTFEEEHGVVEELTSYLKKSDHDLFHLLAELVYVQSSLSIDAVIHLVEHKYPSGVDLHECSEMFKVLKFHIPIELLAAVHDHLDTSGHGRVDVVSMMNSLKEAVHDLSDTAHTDVDHASLQKARKISREANSRRSYAKATAAASRVTMFGENTTKIPGDDGEEQQLIALVAHNDMKPTMMSFVTEHIDFFKNRRIVTTNSTGKALEKALGINVYRKVTSGPLGGDQEIGALVAQDKVAAVFFFRDPLSAHPHDSDINALCRLCDVHNTLVATNRTTGNAMIYSLRHLQCHTALLVPHQDHTESEVIKAYKAKQSRTIADVAVQMGQAFDTNPRPGTSGD